MNEEELAGIAFDWIYRYRLDKGKSVWAHEVMMFLMNFETSPINRFIATAVVLQTLYDLGWIKLKK